VSSVLLAQDGENYSSKDFAARATNKVGAIVLSINEVTGALYGYKKA
jgi:hypothetical protein